jgi:N-hydroxyarylamine O-acetyltransferase
VSGYRVDLSGYFTRIGYRGDGAPTLATLREVHRLHAEAIPFENLTSLSGEVVSLDLPALYDKLVARRRGGYCFEQNTLLWDVLLQLGFAVTGLAARVMWGVAQGSRTSRGHMLLRVALAEGDYLADVGFGGLTFTGPLALVADREQCTPRETLRLTAIGDEYLIEARLQGEWQPLYAFDLQQQFAPDYVPRNWYTCTFPESVFVTTLRLGRPFAGGRHALLNNRYTRYAADGTPTVRYVADLQELRELISDAFLIELPSSPTLERKLKALLASPQVPP